MLLSVHKTGGAVLHVSPWADRLTVPPLGLNAAKPVSEPTLASWKGFVTLIVKGYMEKRWAWFPIDRLQMELTAVTGRTERPHVVAEWARVVHTTLEQVAPQFPSH